MTGWTHNTTTSCSVCGHIHAKHSEGRIIPETRSCTDCGYCSAPRAGRYRPCERCGGTPAVHNPHFLNQAYVGHEYL